MPGQQQISAQTVAELLDDCARQRDARAIPGHGIEIAVDTHCRA
jgi:hypothetical protein